MSKTCVFVIGPPAVGKMTVGAALRDLTGIPLFHNHLSIEAILPVFRFGTPPFSRLVNGLRRRVFEEVAASDLPGLIFTYAWAFDEPADYEWVARTKSIFESRGGRTVFVELWADLETRLARNTMEDRLSEKPSKRNLEDSRTRMLDLERRYRMNSDGDFPYPADHLWLDTTRVDPEAAARRIATQFEIPIAPSHME